MKKGIELLLDCWCLNYVYRKFMNGPHAWRKFVK